MSVKQPSLRTLTARYLVRAFLLVTIFGGAAASQAATKQQGLAEQDKDKKGEKKDEKKEENKGLPLKPDRKIEFTTDEGTWLSTCLPTARPWSSTCLATFTCSRSKAARPS